jgi:hypothetical protein
VSIGRQTFWLAVFACVDGFVVMTVGKCEAVVGFGVSIVKPHEFIVFTG